MILVARIRNGLRINGPIIDESETIPDHSQLLDAKELDTAPDEVVTSEPGPSETVGVLEAAAEAGLSSVAAELVIDEPEAEISEASMEAISPSDADAQPSEAEEQTEGETGERLESEINVDTGMEELETKEEATEVAEAPEVTEMKSKED
ncbi:hypothetical protein scyTo_0006926 [Scyliorhinus torazame]|uniref:Uncharacterized protein n=1 Tax=Scyliorhinus torazame TaxID=75743 RepID=A0A401NIR8_SCYTO|nr:hypothetical protein [Scyliorhinus torazame]